MIDQISREQSLTNQTITESQKMTVGFWSLCFMFLVGLDLATKLLAHKFAWPIFYNYNFAFSIPMPTVAMYSLYAVVLLLAGYFLRQSFVNHTHHQTLGWVMILAGGLSNVTERVIYGSVTDFIFIWTGVFNVADFLILGGLLVIFFSKDK